MRRIVTFTFCIATVCFSACAEQPGVRLDLANELETKWEGFNPYMLVQRIQNDYVKTQPLPVRKQWLDWVAAMTKDRGHQRELLLKSGLLESAVGDCKLAVQELAVQLDTVLTTGKRVDRQLKREKSPMLEQWKPVYELIQKEDFKAAHEKFKAFKVDDAAPANTRKTLLQHMTLELKQRVDPQTLAAPTPPAPAPEPAGDDTKKP